MSHTSSPLTEAEDSSIANSAARHLPSGKAAAPSRKRPALTAAHIRLFRWRVLCGILFMLLFTPFLVLCLASPSTTGYAGTLLSGWLTRVLDMAAWTLPILTLAIAMAFLEADPHKELNLKWSLPVLWLACVLTAARFDGQGGSLGRALDGVLVHIIGGVGAWMLAIGGMVVALCLLWQITIEEFLDGLYAFGRFSIKAMRIAWIYFIKGLRWSGKLLLALGALLVAGIIKGAGSARTKMKSASEKHKLERARKDAQVVAERLAYEQRHPELYDESFREPEDNLSESGGEQRSDSGRGLLDWSVEDSSTSNMAGSVNMAGSALNSKPRLSEATGVLPRQAAVSHLSTAPEYSSASGLSRKLVNSPAVGEIGPRRPAAPGATAGYSRSIGSSSIGSSSSDQGNRAYPPAAVKSNRRPAGLDQEHGKENEITLRPPISESRGSRSGSGSKITGSLRGRELAIDSLAGVNHAAPVVETKEAVEEPAAPQPPAAPVAPGQATARMQPMAAKTTPEDEIRRKLQAFTSFSHSGNGPKSQPNTGSGRINNANRVPQNATRVPQPSPVEPATDGKDRGRVIAHAQRQVPSRPKAMLSAATLSYLRNGRTGGQGLNSSTAVTPTKAAAPVPTGNVVGSSYLNNRTGNAIGNGQGSRQSGRMPLPAVRGSELLSEAGSAPQTRSGSWHTANADSIPTGLSDQSHREDLKQMGVDYNSVRSYVAPTTIGSGRGQANARPRPLAPGVSSIIVANNSSNRATGRVMAGGRLPRAGAVSSGAATAETELESNAARELEDNNARTEQNNQRKSQSTAIRHEGRSPEDILHALGVRRKPKKEEPTVTNPAPIVSSWRRETEHTYEGDATITSGEAIDAATLGDIPSVSAEALSSSGLPVAVFNGLPNIIKRGSADDLAYPAYPGSGLSRSRNQALEPHSGFDSEPVDSSESAGSIPQNVNLVSSSNTANAITSVAAPVCIDSEESIDASASVSTDSSLEAEDGNAMVESQADVATMAPSLLEDSFEPLPPVAKRDRSGIQHRSTSNEDYVSEASVSSTEAPVENYGEAYPEPQTAISQLPSALELPSTETATSIASENTEAKLEALDEELLSLPADLLPHSSYSPASPLPPVWSTGETAVADSLEDELSEAEALEKGEDLEEYPEEDTENSSESLITDSIDDCSNDGNEDELKLAIAEPEEIALESEESFEESLEESLDSPAEESIEEPEESLEAAGEEETVSAVREEEASEEPEEPATQEQPSAPAMTESLGMRGLTPKASGLALMSSGLGLKPMAAPDNIAINNRTGLQPKAGLGSRPFLKRPLLTDKPSLALGLGCPPNGMQSASPIFAQNEGTPVKRSLDSASIDDIDDVFGLSSGNSEESLLRREGDVEPSPYQSIIGHALQIRPSRSGHSAEAKKQSGEHRNRKRHSGERLSLHPQASSQGIAGDRNALLTSRKYQEPDLLQVSRIKLDEPQSRLALNPAAQVAPKPSAPEGLPLPRRSGQASNSLEPVLPLNVAPVIPEHLSLRPELSEPAVEDFSPSSHLELPASPDLALDNGSRRVISANGHLALKRTPALGIRAYGLELNEEEESSNKYRLPGASLLDGGMVARRTHQSVDKSQKLVEALASFGVHAKVLGVIQGPAVTRYELEPAKGVRVNRFTSLTNDIALALAAKSIRIEAPVPGKSAIGIEVPNDFTDLVVLKDIITSDAFQAGKGLCIGLGKDITGYARTSDLAKMPHLLVAGTTGSGKSVCINTLILSLIYKFTPEDLQLLMIDPKQVELSIYEGLPHLIGLSGEESGSIVVEPKKAACALHQMVELMEARYTLLAKAKVRNIDEYNQKTNERLPWIVIIIDELADLMMAAPKAVETSICRLAQKARAAGLHLVVATQRPSTDVITGLIKVNIPSRIAFAVSSQVDSRVILDVGGAEHLLGKGDMLFKPVDASEASRIQGAFVTNDEIQRVVDFWSQQGLPENRIELDVKETTTEEETEQNEDNGDDDIINEALAVILRNQGASASMLQTELRIGYSRARRVINTLEKRGYIGPKDGSKPRKIYYTGDGNDFSSN